MLGFIGLFFLCLHILDWFLKKLGFFKSDKLYFFDSAVLKHLGYSDSHYFYGNDIVCILQVQKRLEHLLYKENPKDNWAYIMTDLQKNRKLEEAYLDSLKRRR